MNLIPAWCRSALQQLFARDAHDPYDELRRQLDERTLRDIGLDGEAGSRFN